MKIKLKTRIILLIVLFIFSVFILRNIYNYYEIFARKVDGIVILTKYKGRGGYSHYYTANSYILETYFYKDSGPNIFVGDSIYKPSKSMFLKVYIRNKDKWVLKK